MIIIKGERSYIKDSAEDAPIRLALSTFEDNGETMLAMDFWKTKFQDFAFRSFSEEEAKSIRDALIEKYPL